MPPARRTSSNAAAAEGRPPTRWAMPLPATVASSRPITMRPLSRWAVGWRKQRTATTVSTIGTSRANQPTVPPTTEWTTRPTAVSRRPHHSIAATSAAIRIRSKPVPSRRSSRGMRMSGPALRTAAPTGVARAIHAVRRARTNAGCWSRSEVAADAPFPEEPFTDRAEPDRDFDEEDDDRAGEVRVAMDPTYRAPRTRWARGRGGNGPAGGAGAVRTGCRPPRGRPGWRRAPPPWRGRAAGAPCPWG